MFFLFSNGSVRDLLLHHKVPPKERPISVHYSLLERTEGGKSALDEVKDGDSVADGGEDGVAVRSKEDVALTVDGSYQVRELHEPALEVS
jgi:hypothetical protein